MKMKSESFDVGVIVGRFQVHELHEGHLDLIQTVFDNHSKVVIFLGLAETLGTFNNPLDFNSRQHMIREHFPEAILLYITDISSDEVWSMKLDSMISHHVLPHQSVALYGGRNSFIERYHGKHPTVELEMESYGHPSGTEVRRQISNSAKSSADFRQGAIWAMSYQHPRAIPTVDVAVWNDSRSKLLLGRKTWEEEFRFIGGYAQPDSRSYESDAGRELMEEAGGMEVSPMQYVGSFLIDDWRYRGEVDKIKTLLFECDRLWGSPTAGDDIAEVRWFDVSKLTLAHVVPQHREMLATLIPGIPEKNESPELTPEERVAIETNP